MSSPAAPASPPVSRSLLAASLADGPLMRAVPHLPVSPASIPAVLPTTSMPFDGPQRNCTFVLLAEFDILKGSQCRYQYPRPTKIKENLLAESMLPEGAHLRESDWTVSFLTNAMMTNADAELVKTLQKAREKFARETAAGNKATPVDDSTYVAEVELQDQGYLCMLNLVRTKMDKTVKRGAIVKALAICTRHRFYNIFKPLLQLALDQYFEAATPENQQQILVNLYHTINNMALTPVTVMPPLQQRLLRATKLRTAANPTASDYFNISVPWNSSSAINGSASAANSPANAAASTASLPMRIPFAMEADEVLEASIMTLVNRFQENIMHIYTALMCEKRVIFLGYQQPASVCCECVVSACLLISPPVFGTIHRAFPYANLVNMDFLTVPGFIAGVTNPIFEQRTNWWDLLCNISNGEVSYGPEYTAELAAAGALGVSSSNSVLSSSSSGGDNNREKLATLDSAFFTELKSGLKLKMGEEWARCQFRDLTSHLIRLAQNEEPFLFDDAPQTQRAFHMSAHAHRIKHFLKSKQYETYAAGRAKFIKTESAFGASDTALRNHIRILQLLASSRSSSNNSAAMTSKRTPTTTELLPIYASLHSHCVTREQLLELLSMMPESLGGIFPLALGLLNAHPQIQQHTVDLLQRIDAQPEGNKSVSSLNYFLLMTFYRFIKEAGQAQRDYSDSEDDDDDNAGAFLSPSSTGHHPGYLDNALSPDSSSLPSIPIDGSTPLTTRNQAWRAKSSTHAISSLSNVNSPSAVSPGGDVTIRVPAPLQRQAVSQRDLGAPADSAHWSYSQRGAAPDDSPPIRVDPHAAFDDSRLADQLSLKSPKFHQDDTPKKGK